MGKTRSGRWGRQDRAQIRTAELRVGPGADAAAWASQVEATLAGSAWGFGNTALADATVLVAPDLRRKAVRDWIAATEREVPPASLLLVTDGRPSNLKELRRFVIGAVVTQEEIERELTGRLAEVARGVLRGQLTEAARRWQSGDPIVRETVLMASTAVPPILTRKKLLRFLDYRSPTTVWMHWRNAPACFGTTKEFLQKVALLHFVDLRTSDYSTTAALNALGMSRGTLYESCRRQFGVTPGVLAAHSSTARRWARETIAAMCDEP